MNLRRYAVLFLPALVSAFGPVTALAQVSFKVDITVTSGVLSRVVTLGVHPGNTIGIDTDPALGEYQESVAPQLPPTVLLDARFPVGPGTAIFKDFRGYSTPDQADIFYIDIQGDYLLSKSVTVSWPSTINQYASSWTIKTAGSFQLVPTNMVGLSGITIPPDGFTRSFRLQIVKVGAYPPATPGPTFVLDKTSLFFGIVGVGFNASQTVKVSNTGATNPLNITGAALPPDYLISPGVFPLTVNPGADRTFTVTFAPSATGTNAANIVFFHNAPGGSTNLLVNGNGLHQLGTIFFSSLHRTILDNTTNCSDTIGLHVSGLPLHAVQFTLRTDGQVIFRSISCTLDPTKWALSYDIFRGGLNPFFATDDSINVVLFGIDSNSLPQLDYPAVLILKYDVVNIAAPNETSHIRFSNILGSLFDSSDGNVNSSGDETITVANRTSKGDINFDDHIDVLDLLVLVDHITGRNLLSGSQFTAADLYPYPAGDGAVNVQDLSLLQSIILTGRYPDSTRIMKFAPPVAEVNHSLGTRSPAQGPDARVTIQAAGSGIVIRLQNAVPVRGMQLSLRNVHPVENPAVVSTTLGEAHYSLNGDLLKVLLYSPKGDIAGPGESTVAVLPFGCGDAGGVSLEDIIVAGEANTALQCESNLSVGKQDQLPVRFALEQNYPNPFNPSTEIRFTVPTASDVRVIVYNMVGQQIRTLFTGQAEQGTRVIRWDGKDDRGNGVGSGVYVYRMNAGGFVSTRKMILLK